jgi:carbohydrate-selective porin OprB
LRISRAPFPDQRFSIQDLVVEGNTAIMTWLWSATHQGDIPGFPATGNNFRMSGATAYYFDGGRLTGHWQIADRLGVYMQLRQGARSTVQECARRARDAGVTWPLPLNQNALPKQTLQRVRLFYKFLRAGFGKLFKILHLPTNSRELLQVSNAE